MHQHSTDAFYKSESRYRMLVENSCDIILSLDSGGNLIFVSRAWKDMLGHDLADIIGHNFREFIHPEDMPRCEAMLMKATLSSSTQEVTYRIQNAGGSWRWHTLRGAQHVDENGELTVIGTSYDVTERLRIEEIMAQTEKMLMVGGLQQVWHMRSIIRWGRSCSMPRISNDGYQTPFRQI